MRSNRVFNLFDKRFDIGTFCSFVLAVVPTIVLPVTAMITLGVLGVNAVAIRVAVVLRAVFVRVIRLISTNVLLIRRGRVTVFVVGARFVDIFYGIFVSLNAAVLSDRPFAVAVMTVS